MTFRQGGENTVLTNIRTKADKSPERGTRSWSSRIYIQDLWLDIMQLFYFNKHKEIRFGYRSIIFITNRYFLYLKKHSKYYSETFCTKITWIYLNIFDVEMYFAQEQNVCMLNQSQQDVTNTQRGSPKFIFQVLRTIFLQICPFYHPYLSLTVDITTEPFWPSAGI